MIEILADEHIRETVVRGLSRRGVAVHTVRAEGLAGAPDAKVLTVATDQGRVLLTNDDDFLVLAGKGRHSGIIFQTSQFVTPASVLRAVVRLVDSVPPEAFTESVFFVP